MKTPYIGALNANTTRTIIVLSFPSKKNKDISSLNKKI
jgi:hypothetical protein